jgi:class 3 adenylate cyclase
MIERQNRDLKKEKERVEKLLLNIMPQQVYEEWKEFGVTTPQRFGSASILMLDFDGFTQMAISQEPTKLISELNDIFTAFDRIVEQFGCERLKTIGTPMSPCRDCRSRTRIMREILRASRCASCVISNAETRTASLSGNAVSALTPAP